MAKIVAADIIGPAGMGFVREMFRVASDDDFTAFVTAVVAEQSDLLQGRVGPSVYHSTTDPIQSRIKRAEKCLVAAELIDRRINVRLGDVPAAGPVDEFNVRAEIRQRDDYRSEANGIIAAIPGPAAAGIGMSAGDFASGVLVTSHFQEADLV